MSAKLSTPNFVNRECVGFTHASQTFNRYVQLPEGLYWNTVVCEASHGLTPNLPQIRSANLFDFVWNKFYVWINDNVSRDETCIQAMFIPCDCNNCFFCLKGLTNGFAHKKRKSTHTIFVEHDNTRTMTKSCTVKRVGLKRGSQY
jgi:hypothetical protein